MKVLFIEPSGGLWGSERALLDVIAALPGDDIAVCCPPDTPLQEELDRLGVTTFTGLLPDLHRGSRLRRLGSAFGVLRACLAFRPDVLHLNQSGIYRVALPSARLLRIPLISHVRIFEDADHLAARQPDPRHLGGLVAISHAIADSIRSHPALKAIPVHTIYDAYASTSVGVANTAQRADRIACIGRIVPIKGHRVLLGALSHEPLGNRDLECLVVGDGHSDLMDELKPMAPASGPQVRWMGFVDEIVPLLKTCRLLVCPSDREPLGRVILEAWDAGVLPVVYAQSGGAAEIVTASDGGIVYSDQDPACLAAALDAALDLPKDEFDRMIANGRAWMAHNCGLPAYGESIRRLWESAR